MREEIEGNERNVEGKREESNKYQSISQNGG